MATRTTPAKPSPTPVPGAFSAPGTAPTGDKVCKVCEAPYAAHSGTTCTICRGPVEHHGQGVGERIGFNQCLAGRIRTADARARAGVELDDVDRLALNAGTTT